MIHVLYVHGMHMYMYMHYTCMYVIPCMYIYMMVQYTKGARFGMSILCFQNCTGLLKSLTTQQRWQRKWFSLDKTGDLHVFDNEKVGLPHYYTCVECVHVGFVRHTMECKVVVRFGPQPGLPPPAWRCRVHSLNSLLCECGSLQDGAWTYQNLWL